MKQAHNEDFQKLSPKQQQAIELFNQGQNLFISGGAGSGKSHLLQFFKRYFSQLGMEITASTGVSAINVGGSTIHSFSGIGLGNLPLEQSIENIMLAKMSRVRRKIRQTNILAIDEISMISSSTLDLIDQVFREVRENNKPMGGMQIIFFGDFLQLPPISRYNENFDFCFNSSTFKELDLQVIILDKIFRQDDANFIKILQDLRFGKISPESRIALESRLNADDDNTLIRPTILTTHNAKVEKINHDFLKKIPQEEIVHHAKFDGNAFKIEFFKKNCLASETLRLRVGAQVMMIKNTYQKEGIINGSLGIVKGFSSKKNYPIVQFTNFRELTISPEEWLLERFDNDTKTVIAEAKMTQIPLILAWAMTIHKSQGLTLDKISCDLKDSFSHGQAYVALSRARSLSGINIESIDFNKISADPQAVEFYSKYC
jgi:ATP-dependent exoDNAse (exonuclease V) alpha subunit